MLSTFFRLETLDPGFERDHVLLVAVDLRNGRYSPARRGAIFEEMLERLRALTGVNSASASGQTPIDGSVDARYLQFDGYTSKGPQEVYDNSVSDRFFQTLGTDLLAGRDFNSHDTPESPKVAIVNQTLAKKFFAGQNPIGSHFRVEEGNKLGDPVEIVGVVKDAKYIKLGEENRPITYLPASQNADPDQSITFELRANAGAPTSADLRREILHRRSQSRCLLELHNACASGRRIAVPRTAARHALRILWRACAAARDDRFIWSDVLQLDPAAQ